MRIKALFAVGALAALTLVGSASAAVAGESTPPPPSKDGGPTSVSYASTSDDPAGDAKKFSACVRRNGVPDFPDPKVTRESDGKVTISLRLPDGVDKDKVAAASEKCRKYAPPKPGTKGVEKGIKITAKDRAHLVKFARCMRAQGISNFPLPKANGEIALDAGKLGIDPDSQEFQAAERACQKYLPDGGKKQKLRHARPAPEAGTSKSDEYDTSDSNA